MKLFQTCMSVFLLSNTNVVQLVPTDFYSMGKNTMKVNGYRQLFGYQHSSKYLLLCSKEERNSYRFGTMWGWVSDDNLDFWLNYAFKTQKSILFTAGMFTCCSLSMMCHETDTNTVKTRHQRNTNYTSLCLSMTLASKNHHIRGCHWFTMRHHDGEMHEFPQASDLF